MRSFYARHFLVIELVAALTLGGAFIACTLTPQGSAAITEILKGNRTAIYATLASVFGALLGFVITSISIVLGYVKDERLKILRDSKHYETLWRIFISSTRWLAVATVLAIIALIFDRDTSQREWLLNLTVTSSFVATLRIGRAIWVVEKIVWAVVRRSRQDH